MTNLVAATVVFASVTNREPVRYWRAECPLCRSSPAEHHIDHYQAAGGGEVNRRDIENRVERVTTAVFQMPNGPLTNTWRHPLTNWITVEEKRWVEKTL